MKKNFSLLLLLLSQYTYGAPVNILTPSNGIVGQYEKIEFGIELPLTPIDYQQKINTFFGSNSSGVFGSGCVYNSTGINPYDPDQISVEATFKCPGQTDQIVYGFYYRDYSYSTGSSTPSFASTNWVENTALQYHWRVRFAPKFQGNWQVTLVIKVNGVVVLTDNVGKNFTCVTSNNKGFLKKGSSNKYFVNQYNETVFPTGLNFSHPEVESFTGYDHNQHYPSRYYNHREKIKKIVPSGANLARVFSPPYSFKVEWENTTIYDACITNPLQPSNPRGTNRQAILWEFDNLLNMAHDNNIYIQFVLEDGEGLNSFLGSPGYDLAWPHHPYVSKYGLNTTNNNDFFLSTNSINAYKKRLRYIIARWGYSTNIAAFELTNEIHLIDHDPTKTLDQLFVPWDNIMLSYIKGASGLNHTDHLFTTSYEDNQTGLIQVGYDTNLDFLSRHTYYMGNDMLQASRNELNIYTSRYAKPCQTGEIGYAQYSGCYGNGGPAGFMEYMNPSFHSMLWGSSFSGGATSGLNLFGVKDGIDLVDYRTNGQNGLLQHFPPLISFLKNIDLNQGNYAPIYDQNNSNIESFMLLNNNASNANSALGYVRNKSYWWYNFTNPNCANYDANFWNSYHSYVTCGTDGYFTTQSTQCPLAGQIGNVQVSGLVSNTTLGVEWYSTYLNSAKEYATIKTDLVTSNASGIVTITPPDFGLWNNTNDYAFKMKPYVGDACARNHNDISILAKTDNASAYKELTMNNRCLQMSGNGAFRTVNMVTNKDSWINNGIDYFQGWMDPNDRLFSGDMDNDGKDEMILVNTDYISGAVMVVDPKTRVNKSWINHGTFGGWMETTDKMFLNDVNNDGKADLILVNTDYNYGAIRAIDLTTGGNISWINHGSPTNFTGFMDNSDKMFVAKVLVGSVTKTALVLVNTDYSSIGAVKVIDILTGNTLCNISQGLFGGWMDTNDKMFVGDVDADSDDELVIVNEGYQYGAILAVDLSNPNPTATRFISNGSPSFMQGFNDYNDKILFEDVNGDSKKDLVFCNNTNLTSDPYGYLKVYDINNQITIRTVTTGNYVGFLDCNDKAFCGNVLGTSKNDILLSNSDYSSSSDGFLIYDFDANTTTIKSNSLYSTNFGGWKDGTDKNSICHTEVSGHERLANTKNEPVYLIKNDKVSILPNPSDVGYFKISGLNGKSSIVILSSIGQKVLELSSENESEIINCIDFKTGIYHVMIVDENGLFNDKIIISNQ